MKLTEILNFPDYQNLASSYVINVRNAINKVEHERNFKRDDFISMHLYSDTLLHQNWQTKSAMDGLLRIELNIVAEWGGFSLSSLYDGDEKLDVVDPRKIELVNFLEALKQELQIKGVTYISPSLSEEKIEIGKFDVETHLNVMDQSEAHDNDPIYAVEDSWILYFPLQQLREGNEQQDFWGKLRDSAYQVIDPEGNMADAIDDSEYTNMDNGFRLFMSLDFNIGAMSVADLYDGNDSEFADRAKQLSRSIDISKLMREGRALMAIISKWKEFGLKQVSFSGHRVNGKPTKKFTLVGAQLRLGDVLDTLNILADPKTRHLKAAVIFRFPPVK